MGPNQFSLRMLFIQVTVVACVVGACIGFGRFIRSGERQAIRNAIRDGRLDPEKYRDMLGDEVDKLRPAKQASNPLMLRLRWPENIETDLLRVCELRSLFLDPPIPALAASVGALLVWTAEELSWIDDRHEALAQLRLENQGCQVPVALKPAPWSLRFFGEQAVGGFFLNHPEKSVYTVEHLRRLFPESEIWMDRLAASNSLND